MRVVILISVFERGGAERQALLLARELRRSHGVDAQVWALCYPGSYQQDFENCGIPTRVLDFRWPRSLLHWGKQLPDVVKKLRGEDIDVLLPFTTWPNVVAGLAYRLAGIPVCIWGERHSGGERVPGFEHIAARQYGRFVANSTAGAAFLREEMRIRADRISVVHNGVEAPATGSRNGWREKLGASDGRLLAVKVANLTAAKDHETLIRAWKIVVEKWPAEGHAPLLVLAGRHDETHDACRRLTRELEIEHAVSMPGGVPNVADLIKTADLGVFSSRAEGMPNGVLECMAAGKAVVASDLPGVRDALGPECADVLAPIGDAAALAIRLLEILPDAEKRAELGASNLRRIETAFSVAAMAEQHMSIIQDSFAGAARFAKWRRPSAAARVN